MAKVIIGNWKMYPTLSDSLVLTATLKKGLEELKGVEVIIAPPQPWLVPVIEAWGHRLSHVHFASQNIWPDDQGAFTGETSAYLLKNLIRSALVGHSERRLNNHETNDLIHEKILSC